MDGTLKVCGERWTIWDSIPTTSRKYSLSIFQTNSSWISSGQNQLLWSQSRPSGWVNACDCLVSETPMFHKAVAPSCWRTVIR